jgi:hypothetical protein
MSRKIVPGFFVTHISLRRPKSGIELEFAESRFVVKLPDQHRRFANDLDTHFGQFLAMPDYRWIQNVGPKIFFFPEYITGRIRVNESRGEHRGDRGGVSMNERQCALRRQSQYQLLN